MRLYLAAIAVLIASYLAVLSGGLKAQEGLSRLTLTMAVVADTAMTVDSGQSARAESMLREHAQEAPAAVRREMLAAADQIAQGDTTEAWRSLVYAQWESQLGMELRRVLEIA